MVILIEEEKAKSALSSAAIVAYIFLMLSFIIDIENTLSEIFQKIAILHFVICVLIVVMSITPDNEKVNNNDNQKEKP